MKTNLKPTEHEVEHKQPDDGLSPPHCPFCGHPMQRFLTVPALGREPELQLFSCIHCNEATHTLH